MGLKPTIIRRVAGLTAAALLGTFTLAAPALAGPLPDPAQTGNLYITKLETPTGAAGDGTQLTTPLPNAPIPGVEFTVKKVKNIDLTTQAGWTAASALGAAFVTAAPTSVADAETAITSAPGSYTLDTAVVKTTGGNGLADFTGLPLGVYLVEETATPAGVTSASPFLVTLPMTDPDPANGGAWLYDVYVYPKDATTNLTKTVADAAAAKLGDTVTYTITGAIPDSQDGSASPLTGYLITDTLAKELTYGLATVSVPGATLASTDYTITPTANADGTTTVDVRFTATGLAILGANRGGTVTVTITAAANAIGEVANTAYLYPDGPSVATYDAGVLPTDATNPYPPVASTPVETKWGAITVEKLGTGGKTLQNATFQVFTSATDAEAGTNPVTIGGVSNWTTDATGKVTIAGLRYSDWADGAAVAPTDPGYITYYLVETVAPAGYALQADPIAFTVDSDSTNAVHLQSVTDIPANTGFPLPFTGGTGVTIVYAAGLVILLAALAIGVVVYRRRVAGN